MSDKVTAAELLADIDSPDFEAEQLILRATELLIDLMERQGITRSELAERIGKTKGYVSQIFSGQRNMTMRTLAEIGYALGYRFEVQPRRLRGADRSDSILSSHDYRMLMDAREETRSLLAHCSIHFDAAEGSSEAKDGLYLISAVGRLSWQQLRVAPEAADQDEDVDWSLIA